MAKPISVLIVEDSPADAELVLRQLRRAGFDPTWTRVDNEADLRGAIQIPFQAGCGDLQQFGPRLYRLVRHRL